MPCIAETIRNHCERPVDWTDADKGRRRPKGFEQGTGRCRSLLVIQLAERLIVTRLRRVKHVKGCGKIAWTGCFTSGGTLATCRVAQAPGRSTGGWEACS